MAGAGLRPGDIDQACAADLAGIEFIKGGLANQAGGGNADAAIPHQYHVSILELHGGQFAAVQEFVQIDIGDNLFAAFDRNMSKAAAFRHNAARLIDVIENGILLSAGVASGIENVPGYKNSNGLRAHQIGVELNIRREDRRNLILDGVLQLRMAESAHRDGADLRHKDVPLLIHNKDVVISKGSPDAEHDAVAGRNDILGLQAFMIGIGKVAPEEICSVGFQPFHQRRGVGSLRPGGRSLQRHRLALGRTICRSLLGGRGSGRSSRLRIQAVGILHAGARGLDARCSGNRVACCGAVS